MKTRFQSFLFSNSTCTATPRIYSARARGADRRRHPAAAPGGGEQPQGGAVHKLTLASLLGSRHRIRERVHHLVTTLPEQRLAPDQGDEREEREAEDAAAGVGEIQLTPLSL